MNFVTFAATSYLFVSLVTWFSPIWWSGTHVDFEDLWVLMCAYDEDLAENAAKLSTRALGFVKALTRLLCSLSWPGFGAKYLLMTMKNGRE